MCPFGRSASGFADLAGEQVSLRPDYDLESPVTEPNYSPSAEAAERGFVHLALALHHDPKARRAGVDRRQVPASTQRGEISPRAIAWIIRDAPRRIILPARRAGPPAARSGAGCR